MKTFPLRPRQSRKRHDVKNKINELYQEVKKIAPPFLASHLTLALQIEPLDITPQGEPEMSFFSPLSMDEYNSFPLAETPERSVRMQGIRISMDPELSESATADASDIFLSFAWLVSCAPRRDVSKDGNGLMGSLGQSKGWSFQEYGNFDSRFLDNWLIIYLINRFRGFLASMPRKSHISCLLAMNHGAAGDERLLKGDVLAILAALLSRMECAELQEHMVIPIMLFSFMGYHAKIIEAYHNGDKLIIRQSPLLKFDDYDTAPIDVFVRYIASEAVGDTKEFPQKKPEEMQQIQDSSRRNMFKDRFSTFGRQSKRQLATASSIFTVEGKKSKG